MPTIERCERISKIVTYSVVTLLGVAIIVVTILSVIPRTYDYYDCTTPYPPYNIWFTNYGGGNVKVSWYTDWTHLECETSFLLMYTYNGLIWYNTSYDDFALVNDLYICSRLQVRIWAVNKWGDKGPYYSDNYFLVIPENQPITDITAYEMVDGALLTWSKPENLTRCDLTYRITYSSEIGIKRTTIEDSQLIIPHKDYCFYLYIIINLFVNSEFNSVTGYEHKTEVAIEGYKFQVSPDDPEEFIVTWDSNAKEEICSVKYIVSYDTMNAVEPEVITTNTTEARFHFIYCEEAWIYTQILIFNGDTISSSNGIVAATQYPESITDYGVIGLDYTSSTDMVIITWQPWQSDPLTKQCSVHYQVKIATEFDNYAYTSATPLIEFPKDSHCLYLRLEIQAFVGHVPVGNPAVLSSNIGLEPVQNLKLTQSTEPVVLTISWLPPAYHSYCDIVYTVSAENAATDETNACTGITECQISLSDFCPTTEVAVKASLLNGEAIDGVVATEVYVC